ncbi:site-specific integrase [Phyllobacterium pellucidum]|uniref:site-specific integrase n=1 Tax=Phyllobacterium pellucidum TaxID=2740464 RepID=UPI001D14B165|nr:site-specific integrase [Phyllobacterium sp. T1018]UGY10181.1 site-specific integrase [Phyllobacterium sp. T1018]
MSRKAENLQLRGSIYWLRLRVPDELRPLVGKTEIKKSLKTGDLREAKQLARFERVRLDAEWELLRARLRSKRDYALSDQEIWYLVSKWFVKQEKRNSIDISESVDDAHHEYAMATSFEYVAPAAYQAAKTILAEEGLEFDLSVEGSQRLERVLHPAIIEIAKRDYQRTVPGVQVSLDPQFAALSAQAILQPVAKLTLNKLMREFLSDATRVPLSGKSAKKREAQWDLIKAFFEEDTPIESIDRQRVREFMSLIATLPSNATKHFPDATIFEAVELGAKSGLPVLSIDTANGYLRQLGSLFRFAIDEGFITTDPTSGLLFRGAKIRAKDRRDPFTVVELQKIFGAPIYTGCVDDEYGYARPGPSLPRRGRFWVPLISLFTGMRLNEICQLTLDDFATEDDVDIILIRGDDDGETKRIKTAAGHRFIPIHSELRNIGLLQYVTARRKKGLSTDVLFPELPLGSTGYRSDPFSKYFARFLDHVKIKDKKKVFHSFRHSYRDALREADISIEKVRALGGWSGKNTEDHYGSGLRASTLAEAIEDIRYPKLDLSYLYQPRIDLSCG